MSVEVSVERVPETHVKCPRCYRFVPEVFPKWAEKGYPPICRRCCKVIWDMEHGVEGNDYAELED